MSRIDQKFSIGFKSGDWEGPGSRVIPGSAIRALATLEVCFGSLSCWKIEVWLYFYSSRERYSVHVQCTLYYEEEKISLFIPMTGNMESTNENMIIYYEAAHFL